KLGGIIEIYEKFTGDDPRKVPMKIFPAVHYSMGGLWVDDHQMTSIPGVLAAGECDYSQHGANRLGANSLLSAIYGGMVAGPNAIADFQGWAVLAEELRTYIFERAVAEEQHKPDEILTIDRTENAYVLPKVLGEWITDNGPVVRYRDRLKAPHEKIQELLER